MNDTKRNPADAGHDSDDLIAELARLVAQDARTAAAPASAYRPEPPQFAPEPEPVQHDAVQQDEPHAREPNFGAAQDYQHHDELVDERVEETAPHADQSDAMPIFDFGFGTAHEVQAEETVSDDPIANLIADADVESYERDTAQDHEWSVPSDSQPAASDYVPSYVEHDHASADFAQSEPVAAQQDRDPLGEIEALIGEAARANSGDTGLPGGRRVKSSFLDDFETDAAVDAAESAILAAAAATGASVHRVEPAQDADDWLVAPAPQQIDKRPEPEFAEQHRPEQFIPDPLFSAPVPPRSEPAGGDSASDYADEQYAPDGYAEEVGVEDEPMARRSRRPLGGFVVPVAAGAVIVALIGGIYFAFFSGPGEPGEAPVLTADTQPLKEPAPPSQNDSTASDSVVFSEIEGNSRSPEDEALVSRDQTNGASGAQVADVLAPENGETALANRPVRTVTVRPDGTIVQAPDSVAGSNVLPVERPDVPAVPNSTLTSDPIGEAIAQAISGGELAATSNAPASAAEPIEADDGAGLTETPSESSATGTATPATLAPTPVARPAGLTAQTTPTAAAPITPLAAETVAAATPAPATPAPETTQAAAGTVGAWVQLSSQRSEADAQADIPSLQSRFGTLFNGATPEVSQVDLGERGIYYRVRLPQPTFAQANSVCSAIQGQGGDCFVLNN
ncbi:SPOR domain-containing protein [Pelagibacterium sp.]|uniref:SPOR domain-containing protein n=1 Tax=Pelagibacterium sp. TaxID=1967288 RepID=UPI003A8EEE06